MSRIPLRVRRALPSDCDAIARLIESVGDASGVAGARQFSSDIRAQIPECVRCGADRPDVTVLVAVDEHSDAIYGLVVLNVEQVAAVDPVPALNVSHLLVDDRRRRHGIGRALLVAAVHEADRQGIDQLVATAVTGSREANRYLARLGFAPLVTRRIASTQSLRRSLGLTDTPDRVARLRRLRSSRKAALLSAPQPGVTVLDRGA